MNDKLIVLPSDEVLKGAFNEMCELINLSNFNVGDIVIYKAEHIETKKYQKGIVVKICSSPIGVVSGYNSPVEICDILVGFITDKNEFKIYFENSQKMLLTSDLKI